MWKTGGKWGIWENDVKQLEKNTSETQQQLVTKEQGMGNGEWGKQNTP